MLAWKRGIRYIPLKKDIPWETVRAQSSAIGQVGTWLSLVEHRVRDAGVAGSNPVVPTSDKYPGIFYVQGFSQDA